MKLKTKALAACLLLSLTMGCAKKVTAPVPGSANQFDSDSYLSLVTTENVIQTTKASLASNAFPASIVGNVKTALNALIQSYNIANVTYQAYHASALAGQATADQTVALQTSLANVQTATADLTKAKGGQ